MSDPYADALGLSERAPATSPRSRSSVSAADWQAASAAQRFGADSSAIAAQEVAQAKTPADRAAAVKTQTYTNAKLAQQGGTPPANDPYAEALGIGTSAPAKPAANPVASSAPAAKPLTGPGALDNGAGAVVNFVTGAGSSIYGGLKGLAVAGKGLVTGDGIDKSLSDAADAVTRAQEDYTFQPRDPTDQKLVSAFNSGANPLNWPAMGGRAVGGVLSDSGHPVLATAADTAGAALPLVFGLKGGRAAASKAGSSLVDSLRPTPVAPRVEPTMEPIANNPSPTLAEVAPGVPTAPNLALSPQQAVPGKSAPFPGAPPPMPVASPMATPAPKPTFSDPANNVFADSAPDVKGGLPAADQAKRAAVLGEIGLNNVRRSALTGDANQAAIDFQTSRLKGSPGGDAMSQQLSSEKQAITDYAEGIAQKTGGSALNDQSAKLARGEAILTPLEGLKEWFDNQTSSLYKTADERAQGVPTNLPGLQAALSDDSLLGSPEAVTLRPAVNALLKKQGVVQPDGSIAATAAQAETVRKYLGQNWSPQNNSYVKALKDAIDDDVTSAAGEDIYSQARALRTQRARTLDDPNGIAKILDTQGADINRKVSIEKVADTLTNMPVAQLGHVVETLKNMPPELQPMAQDALAEIKAQYAHNVKDIGASQQGQWNAKGVQKYLSNNSARMGAVFDPDEMKQFGTLNDAGNILAKDQSYPGAFAQHQNLVRAGVSHAITGGAAAAGGAIAGPLGGAIGGVMGGKLAGKLNDASTLRATQKRMTTLDALKAGGEK